MSVADIESVSIGGVVGDQQLGERLGEGREGEVYRVQGEPSTVVKIFNERYRDEKAAKVCAMIANPPADPTAQKQGLPSIIWPESVVTSAATDTFLGYSMPAIDTKSMTHVFQYAVQNLVWDSSTPAERLGTALNLAIMVHTIHEQGHAIGDFNHKNILIKDGYVVLIDCDGFHISGDRSIYHGETFLPRYAPPEKRGETLANARKGDQFCLSVHIFQLLMEGEHPYRAVGSKAATGDFRDMIRNNPFPYVSSGQGIKPPDNVPEYEQLPAKIGQRFTQSFVAGKESEVQRPTAKDWIDTLQEAKNTASSDSPDRIGHCYRCGAEVLDDGIVDYCHICGTNLYEEFSSAEIMHCYACGIELLDSGSANYCHICGTDVS